MNQLRDLPFRRKQMFVIMMTTTVALLLGFAGLVVHELVTFRQVMVGNLSTLAEMIANNSAAPVQFDVRKEATNTLALLRSEKAIAAAWIFDSSGRVFADYHNPAQPKVTSVPGDLREGGEFNRDSLRLVHPIAHDGQKVGRVVLHSSLDSLYSRLRQYLGIMAVVLVASLGVAFLVSARLQRLISDPLVRLAEVARRVAVEKDYSIHTPVESRDEIGQLVRCFNEMLVEIQRRDVALREAQGQLERRVADRTAELSQAHESLKLEFAERARTEEALLESDERFRLVARATNDVVWDWDLVEGRVWWNQGFESQFGYRLAELEPGLESWIRRLHPDERARVESGIQRAIHSDASAWSDEYRFRRADGSYAYILDRGYVIRDAAHRPIRMVGAMMDITERKRAEFELQRAKESAEAASVAKSHFLANMSHEIRTPMNGIIGMTNLALETDLTADQRTLLNTVKDSADTLLSLINEILDFSKIEAGKFRLESTGFGLRDCIEDSLLSLALRAHQKGLELACHIPAEIPDGLIGDPARLRQIVVNLLGNAIKFTEAGEVVLSVSVENPGAEMLLHFRVRDTGIGIPREKLEMVFEAFTQADASTTRTYGGTGLGLAICRQLVTLMGGRIWVESESGRGSAFHFTARFALDRAAAPMPTPRASLRSLPVLVVDDNASNRAILGELLNKWGMRPTVLAHSREVVGVLERHAASGEPFPLALLDAMMPEMDGFELAARIKEKPHLAHTLIMMLSSADQMEDADRCRRLGIAQYLTKPIRQSDLLDALMGALGSTPAGRSRLTSVDPPVPPLVAARSLRVLLAEDNVVNQRLALRVLAKWKHLVTVAVNGRKAVAAWESSAFDVILMDVQMPEMSGLDATRTIREREAGSGRHIPIIAMTAHAMEGDRARCLDAGMDDYVTKPIDQTTLFNIMERLTNSSATPSPAGASPPSPSSPPEAAGPVAVAAAAATPPPLAGEALDFDAAAAWKRVDGDRELLKEVVGLFLEDSPGLLEQIRGAIASGDNRMLERSAHALKGSVSNFGARTAQGLALQLEQMGRCGELAEAPAAFDRLERQIRLLAPNLEKIITAEAA